MVCNYAPKICAIVINWQLRQVDFIMAYAQALIECYMYL